MNIKKILVIICALFALAACKSSTQTSSGNWLDGDRSSAVGDQRNAVNVVYFAFDSSSLDMAAKEKLKQQVNMWIASSRKPMLVVEGHCDKVGDIDYNLALGARRAEAAKRELVALGIPADKVETISYGKERPAVMDDDSLNRRAVTIATKN